MTRLGAPISTTPLSRGPDKEASIEKRPLGAAIARRENKTPRGSRSITALVRGGLWSTLYRRVGGDAANHGENYLSPPKEHALFCQGG